MGQNEFKHRRVKEIGTDIFWIHGGFSNLYLAVEDEGLTLFDTGVANRASLVFEVIAQLGYQPSDLKQIIVTHADPDHVGSLAAIQRQSGCKVYAGQKTAEYLKKGIMPKHLPPFFQRIAERIVSVEIVDMKAVEIISEGETLPILGGLQVMATPGHTDDHMSFFSRLSGIAFSGDVIHTRRGPLQISSNFVSQNPKQVIQSARKLLNLSPAVFASGHGKPGMKHTSADLMMLFNMLRKKEAKL